MAFVQKSDNGICTCGLQVETYGWTENARSSWSTPTPIASHFGTGYVVQDFDRGPRLTGTSELYRVDGSGASVRIMRQSFLNSPTCFNYGDVLKQFTVGVPYGVAYRFEYKLSPVTFAFIDLLKPDGSVERKTNVELAVDDTYVFRQREDTESWGSPDARILFWPWQETR